MRGGYTAAHGIVLGRIGLMIHARLGTRLTRVLDGNIVAARITIIEVVIPLVRSLVTSVVARILLISKVDRLQWLLWHHRRTVWHHWWRPHSLGRIGNLDVLGGHALMHLHHALLDRRERGIKCGRVRTTDGTIGRLLSCITGDGGGEIRQALAHIVIGCLHGIHSESMCCCLVLDFLAEPFRLLEMGLEDRVVMGW